MILAPIEVGSDFSGVGAFNQALNYLQIPYKEVFACDMDKFARQTFIHNYGEPPYFPTDVYLRDIPTKPLFFYMTSPPCQGFSVAGKREGSNLFFNSHEFITENRPRFFCFENVKGLLSHDKVNKKDKLGRTFTTWLEYLGGKSINGVSTENPHEEAVPYHIYWKVLNSKKHGTPQNRERVFIVGIRDDVDNVFSWPIEEPLNRKLKDVLEIEVDEKYFLSEKMVSYLTENSQQQQKGNGFKFSTVENSETAKAITTKPGQRMDDNFLKIKSATSKGYELATENDSINFTHPNSKTRRGRVGVGVAQTLDTACSQAVMVVKLKRTDEAKQKRSEILKATGKDVSSFSERQYEAENQSHSDTILASPNPKKDGLICIPVLTPDRVEKRQNGRRFKDDGEEMFTITTQDRHGVYDGYRIRRLTPRECFRLMSFPDSFSWPVSDSQAYKQAGNSIDAKLLSKILAQLKPIKEHLLDGI
jgi:DNA (cytosine-5)-methyltransferase 1